MIVSGAQESDSAIHIHVSILPQTPLPSRLPLNIEQNSLCYTVGPCWLSFLFHVTLKQGVGERELVSVNRDLGDQLIKFSAWTLDSYSNKQFMKQLEI